MSKKASMNALTYDVTPWTGPILTKHARKRCTQNKYTKKEKKKKKKSLNVKPKKAHKRGGRSGIRCKTTQKAT